MKTKHQHLKSLAALTAFSAAALSSFPAALQAAAADVPFTAKDITAQANAAAKQFDLPLPEENRADPENIYVKYNCLQSCEGIAVRCSADRIGTDSELAGHRVVWSDGFWSAYYFIYPDETQYDYLLQPVSGFAEEYGQYLKYEDYLLDGEQTTHFSLTDDFAAYDGEVYMLSCKQGGLPELAAALMESDDFEVLGIVTGLTKMDAVAYPSDYGVTAYYQDGTTQWFDLSDELLAADFDQVVDKDWARAILDYCDEIAASDPQILYVLPQAGEVLEELTDTQGTIGLMQITHTADGDVNADGKVDVMDAIILARICAEDQSLPEISALGKANTDVTQDGSTDSSDLNALLDRLAGIA